MNDPTSSVSFKKKIGITAFVILLLHILLSLVVVFTPKHRVNSNMVSSVYNQLILLGPFFHESRIKSSPHLYVRYKFNKVWSPFRDYGLENFQFYCEHPWRYDKLHFNDFERYVADQVGKQKKSRQFEEIKNSRAFRELNQFVVQELIQKPVDSVTLVYGFNLYLPEAKVFQFDTLFKYSYNPNAIAPSKKYY